MVLFVPSHQKNDYTIPIQPMLMGTRVLWGA